MSAPVPPPHRLVSASAGSGKTFQLTNALLRLVLEGEDPASILATTFTRVAAAEILTRTLERLSASVLDAAALEQLRAHVPGATAHGCAAALERLVERLPALSILTIDAFFARLAAASALEIGLTPGYRMLDDEEDARVRARAADAALAGEHEGVFFELLRQLQGERLRLHVHRALLDIVDNGYRAFLAAGGAPEPWCAIGAVGSPLTDERLESLREELRGLDPVLTARGVPDKRWQGAQEQLLEDAERGRWEALAAKGLGGAVLQADHRNTEATYYKKPMDEERAAIVRALLSHARGVLTREHAAGTRAAHELIARFDMAYAAIKREMGVATFDDAPRLLARAVSSERLDQLYYRLDGRVRHVLLDEFQDTSMMQFRLLEPILDELLSQDSEGRRVFCVGDPKQSLYAWREAEPTLLPAMEQRWPAFESETLSRSWRSSPRVLDAVNAVFGTLDENAALGAPGETTSATLTVARAWKETFQEHVAAHQGMAGSARLLAAERPADEAGSSVAGASADRLAIATGVELVRRSFEDDPGASIALIVRSGKHLRSAMAMLKRLGVPASEARGNPLTDAPVVAAAASLLQATDHPGDTAALHHVARSPLGAALGMSDASEARSVAEQWRRRIADRGVAAALERWYEAVAAETDAHGSARFLQLLALADRFDAERGGTGGAFARVAETKRVDEPGGTRVRVMTIHGSKGLEFDHVVVPCLSRAWRVAPTSVIAARDVALGPVTRISRYPNEVLRMLDPRLGELYESEQARQINEELCCLYVAMTRARRRLDLVVPPDERGSGEDGQASWSLSSAHVIRAALAAGEPATPGAVLWSSGEPAAGAERIEPKRVASVTGSVTLRLGPVRGRSAARLATLTPSQAGTASSRRADDLLAGSGDHGRTYGGLVHAWFERVGWLDDGVPEADALREASAEAGYPSDLADAHVEGFLTILKSPSLAPLLRRSAWIAGWPGADEARVTNERPFAVRAAGADQDRLLQGRFDRLVVARSGGIVVGAEVVDYKTERIDAEASPDALGLRHRPQLEAYGQAAGIQLGLDPSCVRLTLVFTSAGRVVTVAPGP